MKDASTTSAPLLSVIIPTCHRNADLAVCLERLAPGEQRLGIADYEVIVTDDGRTSDARAMIAERFPWARWVQGPCRGPAANRNNGAGHAKGAWLVFTDDDCIPDAGWLAEFSYHISRADVLEGATVPGGQRRRIDEEAPLNNTGGYLWSCNFAIKMTTFKCLGGFDEGFPYAAMEDVDLRHRLTKENKPVLFLKSAIVSHPWRRRRGIDFIRKHEESSIYFYNKHPELCDGGGVWGNILTSMRRIKNHVMSPMLACRGRGFFRSLGLEIYILWNNIVTGFRLRGSAGFRKRRVS